MTTDRHVYTASDRQAEVLGLIAEAPIGSTTFIGYGGAAGGAKTNLLANLAFEIAIQCPGSNTLVARDDFTVLKETTLAEFDACIPHGLDVRKYDSPPVYRDIRTDTTKPYSRVWFKHLKDDPGSTAYGWVLVDEAQEVSLRRVLYLMTRLRHQPERKWGMVFGFNPFPSWVVEWFMHGQYPDLSNVVNTRVDFHFVRSRMEDNPHLREGYQEMMEATLDPYLKAIMVDGDPDAALGGMLYFNRDVVESARALATDPIQRIPTFTPGVQAPDGEVLIWEHPMNRETYYIGADTADGKGEAMAMMPEKGGSDRNAAAIYKASDNTQVAAIYGRQEEHVYARLLDEWGRRYRNALLAVERNRRSVLVNLRGLEYPNLYWTERPTDMHLVGVANLGRQLEYGYDTNSKTRDVLLSEFREALQMRAMRPRDKDFYKEALSFMGGEKPQAVQGQHDDRVFAHAIAWQARKALNAGRSSAGGNRMRQMQTEVRIG